MHCVMVADQSGDICGATHNAAALLDVIIERIAKAHTQLYQTHSYP